MFGLVVFGFLGLYLVLLIGATVWGYRYAARKGSSRSQRWLWAAGGFLLVYLSLFWDWIPTVAVHQYYCATDAGFWIYKTVDQWKEENPGVAETLVANENVSFKSEKFDEGYGEKTIHFMNDRLSHTIIKQDMFRLLPIIREEWQVVDGEKNEVLARYIDFYTGSSIKSPIGVGGSLRFWMKSGRCSGGGMNQVYFRTYRDNYIGAEK